MRKSLYDSSDARGIAQKFTDGTPKTTVDNQHNADGRYENSTKTEPITKIARTILTSYESRLA